MACRRSAGSSPRRSEHCLSFNPVVETELLTWMQTQTAMIWEMNKTVESEPIG